jgi:hypothetical protein
MWSNLSILEFWKFLVAIKDAQTLGPISLSFHAASPPVTQSLSVTQAAGCDSTAAQPPVPTRHPGSQSPLRILDHIKIYHDVRYAMYIRNVLDAWSFDGGITSLQNKGSVIGMVGSDSAEMVKIRVLKGSRLVLVDEKSKGVLVS